MRSPIIDDETAKAMAARWEAYERKQRLDLVHVMCLVVFAFLAFALGLYILHPTTPMNDKMICGAVWVTNVAAATFSWRRL